ncbi:rare lipoprotein A [Zymomonas mobilis]|nr:rare lipoprotein A [Zymomonas mobilis subsp. mobilis str. CP4 = NRRL B-14023]TQL28321.1 rare lipoprotein A [Zymomonas mobilis]TQL30257.1 rare lipoprotein A [Zymomonas mobilis]TWD59400.1 rare lipoprotein A [Zymomonas mobilis]TWE25148.1 rare lipoprotein A [Zymomonas mobilis]
MLYLWGYWLMQSQTKFRFSFRPWTVLLPLFVAACAGPQTHHYSHNHAPRSPATSRPYTVGGVTYVPKDDPSYNEVGYASWYGDDFAGHPTAIGEKFSPNAISAAHKTLPLPCYVEVTNLETGRRLVVRVNDRGPFVQGRIIDLSRGAARALGIEKKGTAKVRVKRL